MNRLYEGIWIFINGNIWYWIFIFNLQICFWLLLPLVRLDVIKYIYYNIYLIHVRTCFQCIFMGLNVYSIMIMHQIYAVFLCKCNTEWLKSQQSYIVTHHIIPCVFPENVTWKTLLGLLCSSLFVRFLKIFSIFDFYLFCVNLFVYGSLCLVWSKHKFMRIILKLIEIYVHCLNIMVVH